MTIHWDLGLAATLFALTTVGSAMAQDHPAQTITNGEITAMVYLPDANRGFYKTTRFDWSGMIGSVQYRGHNYYGAWWKRITDVNDFGYEGPAFDVLAADFTAAVGPAEEFGQIGYTEAQPGGLFVKPGIGVLRRADETAYNHSRPYEITNGGTWEVERAPDRVEFTHTLTEPSIGFGYVYTKVVRLTPGRPQMVIEHSLRNTGTRPMQTNVYNHNFMTLDNQPPGPDYEISFPFPLQRVQRGGQQGTQGAAGAAAPGQPGTARGAPPPQAAGSPTSPNGSRCAEPEMQSLAAPQGNRLVYNRALEGRDCFQTSFTGFTERIEDNEIRIENTKVGAGVRITGDRPMSRFAYWSIRTVFAPETYINISIEPGEVFTWKWTFDYFVTP